MASRFQKLAGSESPAPQVLEPLADHLALAPRHQGKVLQGVEEVHDEERLAERSRIPKV